MKIDCSKEGNWKLLTRITRSFFSFVGSLVLQYVFCILPAVSILPLSIGSLSAFASGDIGRGFVMLCLAIIALSTLIFYFKVTKESLTCVECVLFFAISFMLLGFLYPPGGQGHRRISSTNSVFRIGTSNPIMT